jgi:glucokinase
MAGPATETGRTGDVAGGAAAPAGVAVGVDVGGTRLRVLAGRDDGARGPVREVPVPRSTDAVVDAIAALGTEAAGRAPITSVAVGLPGWTTPTVPRWIPNLRFLDGAPLAAAVGERLGAPCLLLNDAQATLLAELREGAARGMRSAVLVALGTGIGGAIVLEGRLVRGRQGCAGAFGWLPMDGARVDSEHGGWEQLASGAALDAAGHAWGGAEGLVTAARRGDADARAVVERFGSLLGRGTAALASMLDPDVIVVAGGLSDALDLLRGPTLRAHAEHASPAGREVPVVRAALGPGAGVVGALHAAVAPEVLR